MADYAGQVTAGISDQAGDSAGRIQLPGTYTLPVPPTSSTLRDDLLDYTIPAAFDPTGEGLTPAVVSTFEAVQTLGPQEYWFERVWSKPQVIELGNILSSVTREIELYNAYREADRTLSAATPNAGPGVSFVGLPGLPVDISAQESLVFDVFVSTDGPPVIDGTLDFTLDTPNISIPITGVRVVMFPYEPETPITEDLEFKTDIMMAADGSEQRSSIRKHPRQVITARYFFEDGPARRRMQSLLFTWHPSVFGVPVWFEARYLGADAAINDTVLTVDTRYGDFRTSGLAIVWYNETTFDALEIDSLTDTTITFSSPVTNNYATNQTLVMPLRVGYTKDAIAVARALNSMEEVQLRFTTLDNETSIASTTPWSTHNSKVMLDDPNLVDGTTIPDNIQQRTWKMDNEAGAPIQFSDWPGGHYITRKGFLASSPQAKWQVRQLVHALRGSQVSFYLPTFYMDMIATANLASGSFFLDIEHINYAEFVNGQEPNKSIRIELNDGTILTRQVDSAVELDATTERLTVDVAWGSTIQATDIRLISYLRLVRIAADKVTFDHDNTGDATVTMAVLGVQQ